MDKSRLIRIIICIIFIVAIITLVIINKKEDKNNYSHIVNLNIDMLKDKIDNHESFVLIISRDDCSHCIAYLPVVNKVGEKYGITFYDISQTGLSDDDLTYLRNVANISGTPTTVFIIDGEEKNTDNRLKGEAKEYRLVEKLKAMGYIDENN